jgi:hypothetical protein
VVALITNVTNGRADAYNVSHFTNGHAQLVKTENTARTATLIVRIIVFHAHQKLTARNAKMDIMEVFVNQNVQMEIVLTFAVLVIMTLVVK